MRFCFVVLRESVSANALMVIYSYPADCQVLLPETVVVAVSEIWFPNCLLLTGGWNNFFRSLLKNCSVK